MSNYKNWTIQVQFLNGNMGDFQDRASQYAVDLQAELEKVFTGATVEISHQPGEGVSPATMVFDDNDEPQWDSIAYVDEVVGRHWQPWVEQVGVPCPCGDPRCPNPGDCDVMAED